MRKFPILLLSCMLVGCTPGAAPLKTYKITWNNYDGTELEVDEEVLEGSIPTYDSFTPKKVEDDRYTYIWSGWSPEVVAVKGEAIYTATFTSKAKEYLITYVLEGGENDESNPNKYTVGDSFTLASPTRMGYTFNGWYNEDDEKVTSIDENMTGNILLYADWSVTLNKLTITSQNDYKGTVNIVSGSGYTDERITVEAKEKGEYVFEGWYSDDTLVSVEKTYTFTMPPKDYSLLAKFKPNRDELRRLGGIPAFAADGKTAKYGLYPQSNINDSSLIDELSKLTKVEDNGWYFYQGDYYTKVYARPNDIGMRFNNGVGIISGGLYWFKCEPITWNVLKNNNGVYYLLSSTLLDTQRYYSSHEVRVINNYYVYPNDYEDSDIRAWLNNEFYNSAFNLDNSNVTLTHVDNSAESTNSPYNHYWCNDTEDYVFLPSYQDYINEDYGFDKSDLASKTRQCKTTDYARARGAYCAMNASYLYNGAYWTRSPDNYKDDYYNSWAVSYMGYIGFDRVDYSSDCVRPAINLTIR